MAQYGWADCPYSVKHQINQFVHAVGRVLGENLIGVYLHGSLAMGCFNPASSDLDLLFVVQDSLSPAVKRALSSLCLKQSLQPRPLELSFVRHSVLHPWQHPTPYEFHFSEDWREQLENVQSSGVWQTATDAPTDPDLAAHFTIARKRGICLIGKPIGEEIPKIPPQDYIDALLRDFEDTLPYLENNSVYAVLNFCRIYCYLLEGHICSKDEAGVWAVEYFPDAEKAVVCRCLMLYRGKMGESALTRKSLLHFAAYIAARIDQLAGQGSRFTDQVINLSLFWNIKLY